MRPEAFCVPHGAGVSEPELLLPEAPSLWAQPLSAGPLLSAPDTSCSTRQWLPGEDVTQLHHPARR